MSRESNEDFIKPEGHVWYTEPTREYPPMYGKDASDDHYSQERQVGRGKIGV